MILTTLPATGNEIIVCTSTTCVGLIGPIDARLAAVSASVSALNVQVSNIATSVSAINTQLAAVSALVSSLNSLDVRVIE